MLSVTKDTNNDEWNNLIQNIVKCYFNVSFAIYANKNEICFVLKDFLVYDIPIDFTEDEGRNIIVNDSQKIKSLIDLLG